MIRPELKVATTTKYPLVDGRIQAGTRVVVSAFRVRARVDQRFGGGALAHSYLEAKVEEPKELRGWWSARNFVFWAGEQKIEKGDS